MCNYATTGDREAACMCRITGNIVRSIGAQTESISRCGQVGIGCWSSADLNSSALATNVAASSAELAQLAFSGQRGSNTTHCGGKTVATWTGRSFLVTVKLVDAIPLDPSPSFAINSLSAA
ncbi:hypothetical protein RRF57_001535 [Xylaria bambusicola]|uniref:Uncharacterized protein n=1 Tax=Xylaria bambusicola TaxID=326684 RepID=A0AAN7UQZ6_9PEZI